MRNIGGKFENLNENEEVSLNFLFHVYAITLVNSGHNRYDLEVFPQNNDTSYQVIII
jgi:hypothetical protein